MYWSEIGLYDFLLKFSQKNRKTNHFQRINQNEY